MLVPIDWHAVGGLMLTAALATPLALIAAMKIMHWMDRNG